ncbi:hypothetical protein ACHAQA_006835 [Verticillium albo-atrum]
MGLSAMTTDLGGGITANYLLLGSVVPFLVYFILLVIYRLTLHPLAGFPGPKLAAATYWYETHYDVGKKGRYLWKIIELHRQYGPIVRVNPNEVHISDVEFYHDIYHSKTFKTDRDSFYNLEYIGQSVAFTLSHDLHARRRSALAPYFSMRSIRAMEDVIGEVADQMSSRLAEAQAAGTTVALRHIFTAFALDVISEYAFGKEGSTNLMAQPEFGKSWVEMGVSSVPMNHAFRHFPLFPKVLLRLPESLMVKINPVMRDYVGWLEQMTRQVQRVGTERSADYKSSEDKAVSLIHQLFHSDLPFPDRQVDRLKDEANMIVSAGGETTALVLSRTVFHVLANPAVLQRLQTELRDAFPDSATIPNLSTLATLPFFAAVVDEGLRISMSILSRSPRVFQTHALQYKDWVIPPGMSVSMSPYIVQTDPGIFPEPFIFKPERWIDNKGLQRYQVAFSKGRRACLGINLAVAEIQVGLATVFRRFEMELQGNTARDVEVVRDVFMGYEAVDAKPLKIRILRTMS